MGGVQFQCLIGEMPINLPVNLKRVLDIDDKLFGKFFCVSFNENYRDEGNTYLDYYNRPKEELQCASGLIITILLLY